MMVLGIDPGLERMGFGLVKREGSRLTAVHYGLISSTRVALPNRLVQIYEQMEALLEQYKPDALATERQLFAANKTTAMDVAKALGVAMLCAERHHLPWTEYSPPEIKQAVVGNGRAEKKQVQFMVTRLLSLKETPKPDDVADALAIAITHALRCPPGQR